MSEVSRFWTLAFRWSAGSVIGLAIAAALFGDVIPSDVGVRVGNILAVGFAGFVFLAAVSTDGPIFDLRDEAVRRRFAARPLLRIDLLRASVVAVLAFPVGLYAGQQGVPWLIATVAGEPGAATYTITGWSSRQDGKCQRPYLSERYASLPRRRLCLPSRLPVGTRIEIKGQRSVLGIRANEFRVLDGA